MGKFDNIKWYGTDFNMDYKKSKKYQKDFISNFEKLNDLLSKGIENDIIHKESIELFNKIKLFYPFQPIYTKRGDGKEEISGMIKTNYETLKLVVDFIDYAKEEIDNYQWSKWENW